MGRLDDGRGGVRTFCEKVTCGGVFEEDFDGDGLRRTRVCWGRRDCGSRFKDAKAGGEDLARWISGPGGRDMAFVRGEWRDVIDVDPGSEGQDALDGFGRGGCHCVV